MTSNLHSLLEYQALRSSFMPSENFTDLYNGTSSSPFEDLYSTQASNASYNETDTTNNMYILPWWRQILWSILFFGMIAVATIGNVAVIWIVLAHKRMRTVTNYFILNLSIADAMVSTLNTTLNFVYMLNSNWPFGYLFCKISQFVANTSICASVFTLMAIAIDSLRTIFGSDDDVEKKRLNNFILIATLISLIKLHCSIKMRKFSRIF